MRPKRSTLSGTCWRKLRWKNNWPGAADLTGAAGSLSARAGATGGRGITRADKLPVAPIEHLRKCLPFANGLILNGLIVSMEIKRGIPVSPGVAIGPALVLDTEGFRIPQRFIDKKQRKEEVARLREARRAAAAEARDNQEAINAKLGKQYGAIFAAHALLDRRSRR